MLLGSAAAVLSLLGGCLCSNQRKRISLANGDTVCVLLWLLLLFLVLVLVVVVVVVVVCVVVRVVVCCLLYVLSFLLLLSLLLLLFLLLLRRPCALINQFQGNDWNVQIKAAAS